jgi:hypothetical protein
MTSSFARASFLTAIVASIVLGACAQRSPHPTVEPAPGAKTGAQASASGAAQDAGSTNNATGTATGAGLGTSGSPSPGQLAGGDLNITVELESGDNVQMHWDGRSFQGNAQFNVAPM